ncbi:MAG TPA: sigma-70 family RNA polymerase sigma factor [Acidimicrobiales bacterium]
MDTLAAIAVRPHTTSGAPTPRHSSAVSDELLVGWAKNGDRDALDTLLRRHYDRIHAVCRRMTGNDADAADAAQDALIAVARGLPRFDDRSRFSTWVYRIAVNASIDELRRRARRPGVSLDDMESLSVAAPVGDAPEQAADRVDIDVALRRLPEDFRAAVVLRDLCGLDYAEIAEVLQVPPGTVRSRIARGRAALVGLLEPSGSEP